MARPEDPSKKYGGAFTIAEFCESHGISRPFLYKLWAAGTGPAWMRVGAKRLISVESAAKWRRESEAAGLSEVA